MRQAAFAIIQRHRPRFHDQQLFRNVTPVHIPALCHSLDGGEQEPPLLLDTLFGKGMDRIS